MSIASLYLPQDLEAFIRDKVQSGVYPTESEVVREAIRLLRERDRMREIRLAELRTEIQAGLEEADRGEITPLDVAEIKADGRRILAAQNKGD